MMATKPGTERLALRRTDWPDIDQIIALYADAEVMRHCGDGRRMSPAQVLSQEMPRLMAHNGRPDYLGCWTARERETGVFVGWFRIVPAASAATAELSFRLRSTPDAYAAEGITEMLELARSAEISEVVASATAQDVEAHRLLTDAGMRIVETTDDQVSFAVSL